VLRESTLSDIVKLDFFTPDNSDFYLTKNGFPALRADKVFDDGHTEKRYDYGRIFLHRSFPFEDPNVFISVLCDMIKEEDKEKKAKAAESPAPAADGSPEAVKPKDADPPPMEIREIGLIERLSDFPPEQAKILSDELRRKYFAPKVSKIKSVKEKFGFSYWAVDTDAGECKFTLQDTFRSIIRVGEGRIMINDVDGNRYEIADIQALDRRSFKQIEIYL